MWDPGAWNLYSTGMLVVLACAVISFLALARERDDLHRLLLIDLVEIPSLGIIALLGTDLAEALVLPGLVVGIAELLALSQIYLLKEGLREKPEGRLPIEVIELGHAPLIIAVILVVYGIILSGFTGGGVAGLGVIFFFMAKGHREDFSLLEAAAGISWAIWIASFFVFMFFPEYWWLAVMGAAVGILLKVTAKMSLVGTMWGKPHE
jgi:energy-converting hydrogenase A subunit G